MPLSGRTKIVAQVAVPLLVVPILNIFPVSGKSGTTSANREEF